MAGLISRQGMLPRFIVNSRDRVSEMSITSSTSLMCIATRAAFGGFVCDAVNFLISNSSRPARTDRRRHRLGECGPDGNLSNSYDGAGGEIGLGQLDRAAWPLGLRQRSFRLQRDACGAHGAKDGAGTAGVRRVHRLSRPLVQRAFQEYPPSPPAKRDPQAPSDDDPPMTPAQRGTHGAQQRDENRWVYHPAIDGCVPPPPRDADLLH